MGSKVCAGWAVDVVVVGSGAAGMVAALTAKAAGLDVVIIEKAGSFGGTTAMSGGGLWIPNAPAIRRAGGGDDPEDILAYLRRVTRGDVPEEKLRAYVECAPRMVEFLERASPHLNDQFFWGTVPDYRQDLGGKARGHGIWPKAINRREFEGFDKQMRVPFARVRGVPRGMWMDGEDLGDILPIRWRKSGLRPYRAFARLMWRVARHRILGERIAANGAALAGRLMLALREHGVPLLLDTPMRGLLTDAAGRVSGVSVTRTGKPEEIGARHGVVIATGGFEHGGVRRQYQPAIEAGWSHGSTDNQGDGQLAGLAIGAAVDLMDEAWWVPTVRLPEGGFPVSNERKTAGSFIVNGEGRRFANESADYNTVGAAMVRLHEQSGVSHIPSWLIIDQRTWDHNIMCGHFPIGPVPAEWLDSGKVRTATTIEALADAIGVPSAALRDTTERFNRHARDGRDPDFHRGESAFDLYNADASRPNPTLGEVRHAPFHAFELVPGDLGTKGGLVTDAGARVLRSDGTPIPGLYAAGNASAALMGRGYAGPGATLGPAMTFAWIAGNAIAAEAGCHR